MITIIAVDEQDQQVNLNLKSMAVLNIENFICIDEAAANQLVQVLEQNQLPELADKLRKLTTPSITSE